MPIAKALGLAQTNAVDDAGVIKFVAENGVLLAQERFEQAAIGVETARIEDSIFLAEKTGDRPFELFVQLLRATNEPDGSQTVPVAAQPFLTRSDDRRV